MSASKDESVSNTTLTAAEHADSKAGLDLDDLQLQSQGHVAELPRHFSLLSLLSFSFALMNSWIAFVSLLTVALTLGGPTTAFWSPWVAALGTTIVTLGLAELASAFPSSGGAYHFVFMIAPPRYRAIAAFLSGAYNILAYVFFAVSAGNFVATAIPGLAATYQPSYEPQRWQAYLIYCILILAVGSLVILLPRALPRMQLVLFWASVIGFLVQGISLLARSSPKAPAKTIFASKTNDSGWNDGLAFMLAVGQGIWMFTSLDSATHMAEEIPKPGKNVPIVMIGSLVVGWGSVVFFSLALLFGCSDLPSIPTALVPYHEAVRQGLRSGESAAVFTVWIIVLYTGSIQALIATGGRLVWAFGRDNGLPYSHVFSKVHPRFQVPVPATLLVMSLCIAIGAIYVGSATAFNTFIASSVIFVHVACAIPQLFVLFGGRKRLPQRYLNLGPVFGPFCNLFSIVWTTFYIIMFCFPLYLPVQVGNMNYVSVVIVGFTAIVVAILLLGKSKTFKGPTSALELLDAISRENNATHEVPLKEER